MGLAASQARFLGLTARKSNTEYEGQQVNQQRTALANESASLYSQLTNLSVPTPPDINKYYTTEYSFSMDGVTYTMSQLPTMTENGTYSFSATYAGTKYAYKEVNIEEINIDSFKKGNQVTLEGRDSLNKVINDPSHVTALQFMNGSDLFYNVGGEAGRFFKYIPSTTIEERNFDGATFKYDSTGDFSTISVNGKENIPVTTTNKANDDLYEQAMNQYKKDYSDYEKTMSTINAKTEVIQHQDKSLELRLNQLDTEQNAISTEMDAVQKVIDKNVESTFKTFA